MDIASTLLDPRSITGILPATLAGRGTKSPQPTPLELLLALQNKNHELIFALLTLAIMLYARSARLVHAFVAATALADGPHYAALAYVLGWDGVARWREWGMPLWMQLLVPAVTFSIKVGYLAGAFGPDRVAGRERKRQ